MPWPTTGRRPCYMRPTYHVYDTIRDAILNVRSKADISQLNLPHGIFVEVRGCLTGLSGRLCLPTVGRLSLQLLQHLDLIFPPRSRENQLCNWEAGRTCSVVIAIIAGRLLVRATLLVDVEYFICIRLRYQMHRQTSIASFCKKLKRSDFGKVRLPQYCL